MPNLPNPFKDIPPKVLNGGTTIKQVALSTNIFINGEYPDCCAGGCPHNDSYGSSGYDCRLFRKLHLKVIERPFDNPPFTKGTFTLRCEECLKAEQEIIEI